MPEGSHAVLRPSTANLSYVLKYLHSSFSWKTALSVFLLTHVDLLPVHYHLFILYIHTERGMDCFKDNLNNERILYVNFFLNKSYTGVKCFLRCSGRRYIPRNIGAFSLPSEYASELQPFGVLLYLNV